MVPAPSRLRCAVAVALALAVSVACCCSSLAICTSIIWIWAFGESDYDFLVFSAALDVGTSLSFWVSTVSCLRSAVIWLATFALVVVPDPETAEMLVMATSLELPSAALARIFGNGRFK